MTGKVRGRPWYRVARAGGTAYVHAALVAAWTRAEVAAWARLKDSEKAADFEAFLRHFPRGHFARRARRLAAALKPRVAAVTPPKPRCAGGETRGRVYTRRPGETWTEPSTGMEFVWVPKGCFRMGSRSGDDDERPVHEACVKGFWMGEYEVTQGEWRTVMGTTHRTSRRATAIRWNGSRGMTRRRSSVS